jgi:putative ABC transport system permease protein
MLANYLQIALRTLNKNRIYSFINIFGLALGMTAFLFIVHYVRFEHSYEDFQVNGDNIYRLTLDIYKGKEYVITDCETHAGIGAMAKERFPEVKDFIRMFSLDGVRDVAVEDRNFIETDIYYADPSLLSIFTVNVLKGDAQKALGAPGQAVITQPIANKYFGSQDPLGKSMKIDGKVFTVGGVIAAAPPNTHIKYNILLSHRSLYAYPWYKDDNWDGNNEYTYLLMQPGVSVTAFNKKLYALSEALKDKISDGKYQAQPIKDIHLESNKSFEPEVNGSAKIVFLVLVIAIFIILIAWVNYVNLSTARAISRAREVGIRKVMGSLRAQLILQFLSESFLLNVLSAGLALALFYFLLPFFRDLTGQPLSLQFYRDEVFWYLFAALVATGTMLAGTYPAFVLSSFNPAAVLKGKFQSSSHGQLLRKGLVVFQFGATIVLIVCLFAVYLQINHLRSYDIGMNIDRTLALRAPHIDASDSMYQASYRTFRNEILRNPHVRMASRSDAVPGLSLNDLSTTRFTVVGKDPKEGDYNYYYFSIDADFITTLDMKLVAGRNFQAGVPNHDQVIINEEAAKRLGFDKAEDAVGAKIGFRTRWPGEPATVIGVLKNFYQRSPKEEPLPMTFHYRERADFFSLKLDGGDNEEVIASVKATWEKVFPGSVFSHFFLDDRYAQQYIADTRFGKITAAFSGLAVVIACFGLFGLSSFTIVQRKKEIGIRKVLGASVSQVVVLLSGDFLKVILIGAALAIPAAHVLTLQWLSTYSVRVNLTAWIFVLPVLIILAVAFGTVSFQTIRAALMNPTHSLKEE